MQDFFRRRRVGCETGRTMPVGSTAAHVHQRAPPLRCGPRPRMDRRQTRRRGQRFRLGPSISGVSTGRSSPTKFAHATWVADPLRVVNVANMKLDECHRRDQNEMRGHRSRNDDPVTALRRQARPATDNDGGSPLRSEVSVARPRGGDHDHCEQEPERPTTPKAFLPESPSRAWHPPWNRECSAFPPTLHASRHPAVGFPSLRSCSPTSSARLFGDSPQVHRSTTRGSCGFLSPGDANTGDDSDE